MYYPGLSGPFHFDDTHTIEDNPWIQVESLDVESLTNAAESFAPGGRKVAMLSFSLNHYLFGQSAFAYKAVNLGIHLATGFLLLLLTRLIFARLVNRGEMESNLLLRFGPGIVAGLWLISPINLTSVLYVSQRMNSLSALFVVAGLLIYVVARNRHLASGKHLWIAYPGIALCLYAAYQCKENGVLLLPLLVLVEGIVFSFANRAGVTNWKLLASITVAVLGTVLIFLILADFNIWRYIGGYEHRPFTMEERVLTQGRLLIFYIGLVLFPFAGRFGLWHDDIAISTSLTVPFDTLTSLLLLTLLAVTALATIRRYPLCAFGILWFFIGHSLESSIIPLEMVHEHRNYLPAFGVIIALVGFLGYLRRIRLAWKVVLLGGLAVVASVSLHARATAWSDEYQHAMHEFENHPTSPRATFELAAVSLKLAYRGAEGARDAAFVLFRHAQELGDHTILPEVAMLVASGVLKESYDPEWISSAAQKLQESGGSISDALALRGLRECMTNGECSLEQGDIEPLYAVAANTKIGLIIDEAARFYNDIGDLERTLVTLERAARFAGHHAEIRLNYLWSLIDTGKMEQAREQLRLLEESGAVTRLRNRTSFEAAKARVLGSG